MVRIKASYRTRGVWILFAVKKTVEAVERGEDVGGTEGGAGEMGRSDSSDDNDDDVVGPPLPPGYGPGGRGSQEPGEGEGESEEEDAEDDSAVRMLHHFSFTNCSIFDGFFEGPFASVSTIT